MVDVMLLNYILLYNWHIIVGIIALLAKESSCFPSNAVVDPGFTSALSLTRSSSAPCAQCRSH